MCVCVYTYIHIYMYRCKFQVSLCNIHKYPCTPTRIHFVWYSMQSKKKMYTQTHIRICTSRRLHAQMVLFVQYVKQENAYTLAHTRICTPTRIHAQMVLFGTVCTARKCLHTSTHTNMYAHANTCTNGVVWYSIPPVCKTRRKCTHKHTH
jgi:hypothetical protein